jgi:hypothetical protein
LRYTDTFTVLTNTTTDEEDEKEINTTEGYMAEVAKEGSP